MSLPPLSAPLTSKIPFYRNIKNISIFLQIFFVVAVAILFFFMLRNMFEGLAQQNLKIEFQFMTEEAGFSISEGIPFSSKESYWQAFLIGLVNTFRVAALGIFLSTFLGILIGVGRLSPNYLFRKLATVYVEIIRNIPLLVQLFVWYHVFYLSLPGIRQAIQLPGTIYLSNRGVFYPWWELTETTPLWLVFVSFAFVCGFVTLFVMKRREKRTGLPQAKFSGSFLVFSVLVLISILVLPESPLRLSLPHLKKFNFQGGIRFSPEFMGLLSGLTIYTAAFIAEIVRAGILAVPKGQTEAAQALGFSRFQIFRMIIFPQAMRVIFPPLANQYLNLTKNSSLALVIGFADLFQVSQTISNQSGNAIPIILLVMASYLSMSLFISSVINWFNAKTKMITR
ncbi:MAG: amino acid ABC transporter permease [Nitrospiria bacterium]